MVHLAGGTCSCWVILEGVSTRIHFGVFSVKILLAITASSSSYSPLDGWWSPLTFGGVGGKDSPRRCCMWLFTAVESSTMSIPVCLCRPWNTCPVSCGCGNLCIRILLSYSVDLCCLCWLSVPELGNTDSAFLQWIRPTQRWTLCPWQFTNLASASQTMPTRSHSHWLKYSSLTALAVPQSVSPPSHQFSFTTIPVFLGHSLDLDLAIVGNSWCMLFTCVVD